MADHRETQIPLEDFHRHFVLTHMKDKAEATFDELKREAEESGLQNDILLSKWIKRRYPQGAFQDNNWYAREVALDECYFAHTDFRGYPVPKYHRFVDVLLSKRQEIELGTFPCSSAIRAPWSGPMREPLIQERGSQRYYVLDGQLRVIWHWYHSFLNVRVLMYRGRCDV